MIRRTINKPGGLTQPLPGLPSPGSHPTIDQARRAGTNRAPKRVQFHLHHRFLADRPKIIGRFVRFALVICGCGVPGFGQQVSFRMSRRQVADAEGLKTGGEKCCHRLRRKFSRFYPGGISSLQAISRWSAQRHHRSRCPLGDLSVSSKHGIHVVAQRKLVRNPLPSYRVACLASQPL